MTASWASISSQFRAILPDRRTLEVGSEVELLLEVRDAVLVLGLRLVGEVAQADERVLEAVVLLLKLDERERAAVPVAALAQLLVAGAFHPRVFLAQDGDLDLELGDALLGALECAVRELEPLLGDFLVEQADLDLVRQVEQLGFKLVPLGRELLVLEAEGSVACSDDGDI